MVYCEWCGTLVRVNYCPNCGKKINTITTQHANPSMHQYQQYPDQRPEYSPPQSSFKKIPKLRIIGVIIVILIITLIISGVLFYLYPFRPDNPNKIDINIINEDEPGWRVYLKIDYKDIKIEYLKSGDSVWIETEYKNDVEHIIEIYFWEIPSEILGNKITTKSDVRFTIDPDLEVTVTEI